MKTAFSLVAIYMTLECFWMEFKFLLWQFVEILI